METATETTLTADDIKALRTADDVHARRTADGSSQLEAVKRSTKGRDVFDNSSEGRRVIPCYDHLTTYDAAGNDRTAFAYAIGGQWKPCWPTIVGMLRKGDSIRLRWIAGDSNGYLKAAHGDAVSDGYHNAFAGLFMDHLDLCVIRNGQEKYRFRLDTSVCPNNTARMIR